LLELAYLIVPILLNLRDTTLTLEVAQNGLDIGFELSR
jgi:hypothetical protein